MIACVITHVTGALLAVAACAACNATARRPVEAEAMTEFRGTISAQQRGELDAEVFLLHPDGKVAAVARVQPSGAYAIAPPAGYGGGMLLAKLYRPVVGALVASVGAAPERPIDLAALDAVALDGRVAMPDGVPLEWLDVHLTPRTLDGVPAAAASALLAIGPEPVRRGTYVTRRITQPSFAFAVLPGVYRLEVERVFPDVDRAAAATAPASVQLGSALVANGPPPEPAPIGTWLTVRRPLTVTVQLVVVPPEQR